MSASPHDGPSRGLGTAGDQTLTALQARLSRYPPDRYPVQHATTRFHLGTHHLHAGRITDALEQLQAALDGFAPEALTVERAKTINMIGIARREQGDLDGAHQTFQIAADLFAAAGEVAEEAAACFNRGLIHRQLEELPQAIDCFTAAVAGFDTADTPQQTGAAARELAGCLVESDRPSEATQVLRPSIEDADARGDLAAIGAAANVLGLALLALDRNDDAVTAFTQAVAANPRSLRPTEHATAKANLALALEPDDPVAAAVAARQAAGVPQAAPVSRAQAQTILNRMDASPTGAADLLTLLDTASTTTRIRHWRDEQARWLDADQTTRTAEARMFLQEVSARPDTVDHLEAWFNVALEQPPDQMNTLLDAFLTATDDLNDDEAHTLHSVVSRVLPRFAMPQWMRLRDTLNHLADANGHRGGWS